MVPHAFRRTTAILIVLTLVTLASMLVTKGGLKEILGALSWGSYVPLAIATAAAAMIKFHSVVNSPRK